MKSLFILFQLLGIALLVYNIFSFHLWRKNWCKFKTFPILFAVLSLGLTGGATIISFMSPRVDNIEALIGLIMSVVLFGETRKHLDNTPIALGAVMPMSKILILQFCGILTFSVALAVSFLDAEVFFIITAIVAAVDILMAFIMNCIYYYEVSRYKKWLDWNAEREEYYENASL